MPNNKYPEIKFVDTDTETLVNRLITSYEKITGRTLYPADPARLFILWIADIIIQEREIINESASDERKSHESYVLESFGRSRGGAVTHAERDAAEIIAARSREAYNKLRETEGKHNGRF